MKRFLPWLLPIVVLLVAIPLFLIWDVVAVAKTAGIAMVILTTVAVRVWLYRAGKLRTRGLKVKLTANERYFLDGAFPYYRSMPGAEKKRLEERAGILLAEISFDRFDRKEVGKDECVAFSMVLGALVLEMPYKKCTGKVVVFKEESSPEIVFQGEQPVLFISEALIKDTLGSMNSLDLQGKLAPEIREILLRFYEMKAGSENN